MTVCKNINIIQPGISTNKYTCQQEVEVFIVILKSLHVEPGAQLP